jgi:predicted SprT family Zn-dependent metalloprotease
MELQQAECLAKSLMRKHGLDDWRFRFDRATRRFGCCNFGRREISLSKSIGLLNDDAQVRDTILHEIAHAKAGPKAGHGPVWKAHAAALGCDASRCYDAASIRTPPRQFKGTCPACGFTIYRHRRKQISCGKCADRFVRSLLFVWTRVNLNGS